MREALKNLINAIKGTKVTAEHEKFAQLMAFAEEVAALNPRGLIDLARLYLRPLQTELLFSCAERPLHSARAEVTPENLFMPDLRLNLAGHWNYPQLESNSFQINLATDPVLPCPWHRKRYSSAIAYIGDGKEMGSWEQDSNHRLIVLQPWGIACVAGGNHSIASGILGGQGTLTPTEVWDMYRLLETVVCDGRHYLETKTKKPICEMSDHRIGALFELGRLMRRHRVVPLHKSKVTELEMS